MTATLKARVLVRGQASAQVCSLGEPLSFWGGYDPVTGTILDVHHPQSGICLAGKIVVLPSARGSAGTPACIAEAIRRGVGPAGFVLGSPDVNIATGARVAHELYRTDCPVVCVAADDYDRLANAAALSVAADGTITIRET